MKPSDDHIHLGGIVLTLASAGVVVMVGLAPITMFSGVLAAVLSLAMGLCMGFMLTSMLRTLQPRRLEHVRAVLYLGGSALACSLAAGSALFHGPVALIGVAYAAGLVLPYAFERRLHDAP
jgi:hypothetical protein